jgi:hypothetical protein
VRGDELLLELPVDGDVGRIGLEREQVRVGDRRRREAANDGLLALCASSAGML